MLVIISDLHLTDGSSGHTISTDAFRILRKQLSNLAYAASWRKNPDPDPDHPYIYRPIEELDLVLLGDVLDVIRSNKWLAPGSKVRPWTGDFADKVKEITEAILAHNKDALRILCEIAHGDERNRVGIPEKNAGYFGPGGKTPFAERPVTVRVHYQVGNHDWFYHLRGPVYDVLRQQIIEAMGLHYETPGPFPYVPKHSKALQKTYEEHGVWAIHGDIHDCLNFAHSRDASSLGDVIVVELLNRFPDEVDKRMPDLADCIAGLREVDNVRPLSLITTWIDGVLRRTCKDKKQIAAVKRIWDRLADEYLANPFVRRMRSKLRGWDRLEELGFEVALKFAKTVPLRILGLISAKLQRFLPEGDTPGFENALEEGAFKSKPPTTNFIVYGHTHHHTIVPVDCYGSPDAPIGQYYINSGTWRRVYELAQNKPGEEKFLGYNVMTYLVFFKDGERADKQFETWSGALTYDPPDSLP
jgi:hypothetical protein